MFSTVMSNSSSISERFGNFTNPMLQRIKKKRNQPGNPDPDAEVIALSPNELLATHRYVCEICNKGFNREQNLQLHRRGHNIPWKLEKKINNGNEIKTKKRVYVCPEPKCVHHHPSRALGDLTGIKKHFYRKHHVEKKWKCEKCDKIYAIQSDWKAHFKICGNREYRCNCGTLFSRKDNYTAHKAFCDALAQENARRYSILTPDPNNTTATTQIPQPPSLFPFSSSSSYSHHHHHHHHLQNCADPWNPQPQNPNPYNSNARIIKHEFPELHNIIPISSPPPFSAATVDAGTSQLGSTRAHLHMKSTQDHFTRDFLGLTRDQYGGDEYDHDRSFMSKHRD